MPGIDQAVLAELFKQQRGGILDMFNMFSGGALSRFSIFALGIMPYISASIIMQLMTVVSPTLEALKKEGESGRRKITQYTRYGTFGLALFQSIGIAIALESQRNLVIDPGLMFRITAMITLTTGTMFLMWLGEQITERGIGNGISLIIFAGIAAGFPQAIAGTLELARTGAFSIPFVLLHLRAGRARDRVRRVRRARAAQDPRELREAAGRAQGLRRADLAPAAQAQHGGRDPADLRLVDHPVPGDAGRLVRADAKASRGCSDIAATLSPGQPIYVLLYASAIIFFCFFYTALVFNPKETADNLKKSGAFVPGIRPGDQTARYIEKIMMRLTLTGSIYVTLVCLLPELLIVWKNVPFYFGGTSLLIIVVVTMDFMAQVQAYVMSHQYESLLKKANFKGGVFPTR